MMKFDTKPTIIIKAMLGQSCANWLMICCRDNSRDSGDVGGKTSE